MAPAPSEDALHRQVRTTLRALWDAGEQLEAASSAPTGPAPLLALRGEAIRQASRALPFVALADTADARLTLSRLAAGELLELPEAEVAPTLALAKEAHERALRTLEAPLQTAEAKARRRQVSVGIAVVLACLVAAVVGQWWSQRGLPEDLAAGKPWTTSSKWADCHPEKNECGNYPTRVLFHTNAEQSPWFQVDLGAPTTFSGATIINRQDMAMPLALPLVLEVSDDGKTFKELTRRTTTFDVWHATFAPVTARYFRARVDRFSTLHLEAVRIHP